MHEFYTFFREETGKEEKVLPERWCWEVLYRDGGEMLKQFGDDGKFHQFKEIDQSRLHVFRMINYQTGKFFDLLWPDGQTSRKLVHMYKNGILNNGKERVRFYVFGYETFVSGVSHKVLMAILPTDDVVILEDLGKLLME